MVVYREKKPGSMQQGYNWIDSFLFLFKFCCYEQLCKEQMLLSINVESLYIDKLCFLLQAFTVVCW